jgi:hypothetical protein
MLRASPSLERVQEAMGHASPAIMRRYAHVLQEDVRGQIRSTKNRRNGSAVTRFSTRSAEFENSGVSYVFDFIWLPGPDSNQRPSG